jgi:hypothetical protein
MTPRRARGWRRASSQASTQRAQPRQVGRVPRPRRHDATEVNARRGVALGDPSRPWGPVSPLGPTGPVSPPRTSITRTRLSSVATRAASNARTRRVSVGRAGPEGTRPPSHRASARAWWRSSGAPSRTRPVWRFRHPGQFGRSGFARARCGSLLVLERPKRKKEKGGSILSGKKNEASQVHLRGLRGTRTRYLTASFSFCRSGHKTKRAL